jgi:hypothetical protein
MTAAVIMRLGPPSSGFTIARAIQEPAADDLVKDAADQGLVRDTLLHGTDASGSEVFSGEANVDALILGLGGEGGGLEA